MSSGSTSGGAHATRSSASDSPAAFVATSSASTGSLSCVTTGGRAVNSPSVTLLTRTPSAAIASAVELARDRRHVLAGAVKRRREQPADAARPEHRDVHRAAAGGGASISTPGFITPPGSTAALAPASAAANGSGRWRSYHGR